MTRSRLILCAVALTACTSADPASRDTTATVQAADTLPSQEGYVDVPGGKVWYRRIGNGPGVPLLALHGGPGGTSAASRQLGKLQASIGFLDFSSTGGAKAWGSTLSNPEFEAQCFRTYFDRLHGYRSGEWTHTTKVGNSSYLRRPTGFFRDWAISTVGTNHYRFFSSETRTSTQPYALKEIAAFGVVYDFKWLPHNRAYWAARRDPWAVLDLSYGSYQIDFNAPRLVNPLVSGALASANCAVGAWDLTGMFEGKTLGQLWHQTVNRGLPNTYCILYGDPTLRLKAD